MRGGKGSDGFDYRREKGAVSDFYDLDERKVKDYIYMYTKKVGVKIIGIIYEVEAVTF